MTLETAKAAVLAVMAIDRRWKEVHDEAVLVAGGKAQLEARKHPEASMEEVAAVVARFVASYIQAALGDELPIVTGPWLPGGSNG